MLKMLNNDIIKDFSLEYSEVNFRDENNLMRVMQDVYAATGETICDTY